MTHNKNLQQIHRHTSALPQSFSTSVRNQEPKNSNLKNERTEYDAGITSGTYAHTVGESNRGLINQSAE